MEPQRHFTFRVGIGQTFSKAQFTALDGLAAAAAPGAAARGRFKDVRHALSLKDGFRERHLPSSIADPEGIVNEDNS
jgi:hypothetical protein